MGYYEATVGATSTPALDMMNILDPLMTANSWEFVETYTSSTNVTNIYKSPAAANSGGYDFYVGFNRTATTSTQIFVVIFEIWDAVNKRAIKYAPNGTPTAGSNIPAADGSVNDPTGVLPSATTTNASLYKGTAINLSASSFTYYLNINADRIIWGTSTNVGGYAGIYEPFYYPERPALTVVTVGAGTSTSSAAYGGTTREPFANAATGNFHSSLYATSSSVSSTFGLRALLPFYYANGAPPDFLTGNLNVARCILGFGRGASAPLGILKDLLVSLQSATNGLAGDTLTYTLNGTTYNYVKGFHQVSGNLDCSNWIPKQ